VYDTPQLESVPGISCGAPLSRGEYTALPFFVKILETSS
jgi:hypothetical protein